MPLFPIILLVFSVEAATKIQAVFRGHKVRATMKQGDPNSDSSSKAAGDDSSATKEPTKQELEAEFDPNDKGELLHTGTQLLDDRISTSDDAFLRLTFAIRGLSLILLKGY